MCGLVFNVSFTLEFSSACSCHVCGFETEMNVQFVSHMSLHVDKEQWMFSICCTACDFVTMEEADMKAHVNNKHTGDDPSPSCSDLSLPCFLGATFTLPISSLLSPKCLLIKA